MGNVTSLKKALIGKMNGEVQNARKDALTTELETHTVDTCFTIDTGEWETGIEPKGKKWVIVEQYGEDKQKATEGHNKWIKLLKKNPETKLKDVMEFGF